MTNEELNLELEDRNALVIHFSHHAKMRNGGVFPQDMLDAIKNKDDWNLSCCVLWPSHQMDLPGSVGIMFSPLVSNILSVSISDSGSSTTLDGEELSGGQPLSRESFSNTFDVPIGGYNEWRVRGAEVKGVFVVDPNNICAKKEQLFEVGPGIDEFIDIAIGPIGISKVRSIFPDYAVYTMSTSSIVEL